MTDMRARLHYFDIIKGIAIFMVVMGHVLTMCVRGIDDSLLFKIIGQTHMPLFFFISGYFTFGMREGRVRMPDIRKRALQLLLPMVVVSTLWIYAYPATGLQSGTDCSFSGLWFNAWKNGYWFTPVLFEIIVLYTLLLRPFEGMRSPYMQAILTIGACGVLLAVQRMLPTDVSELISFDFLPAFFPVFMAGVIARRNNEAFMRACSDNRVITAALIAVGPCLAVTAWPWKYPTALVYVFSIVKDLSVALIAIAAVRPWAEHAFGPDGGRAPIARLWQYIGKRSLAIYLLHYFFLFPMGFMRETLVATGKALVPTIFFSAVCAAVIIAVVLLIDYILSSIRPLSMILTGGGTDPKPLEQK